MKLRSYEFYEVRTNLSRDDEKLQCRGSLEVCTRQMQHFINTADLNQGNVYLMRVQLVEAYKADKA